MPRRKPAAKRLAELAPGALEVLAALMTAKSEPVRLAAAKEVLDRAHGKAGAEPMTPPAQPITEIRRTLVYPNGDVRAL